ncbi:hypothetical protein Pdis01_00191 [Parabacteroides distasonis]|uniref:Uncharacterized protein n=1 Tax=Parabacteroides distasonis TaxID=823 RepID=A0A173V8W8_PARDI|nr:Uncharacterised protein [Parabacteroides distasonis]
MNHKILIHCVLWLKNFVCYISNTYLRIRMKQK